MKRLILLGFALVPAIAGAESNADQFNAGLKPILTQSTQVQMAISCGFVPNSIAQGAAMKMAAELNTLIAHVWNVDPNAELMGAPEAAWKTGMQLAEASGTAASTPTKDECRAFKQNGGVTAVKATFGGSA